MRRHRPRRSAGRPNRWRLTTHPRHAGVTRFRQAIGPGETGGQPLGLWEDAQAQHNAMQNNQVALGRMRAEAAQREQYELREFVNAMARLGIPAKQHDLYYVSSARDAPTTYPKIKGHYAYGWHFCDEWDLVITPDARITTRQQSRPTGFRGSKFVMTYQDLPFVGRTLRNFRSLSGEDLGQICNYFDYADVHGQSNPNPDRWNFDGRPNFTPLSDVLRGALAYYMHNR